MNSPPVRSGLQGLVDQLVRTLKEDRERAARLYATSVRREQQIIDHCRRRLESMRHR